MKNHHFYVYILASRRNGTLYIGVTSNLIQRVEQHKNSFTKGFTKKYGVYKLVYFENHKYINNVLLREKQLKSWKRDWKIKLIEATNPLWKDLIEDPGFQINAMHFLE